MPRSSASKAGAELLDQLTRAGVKVSGAQLERWRSTGAIPRNVRTPLGRGRGSTSTVPPDSVALASAMGAVSLPGRSVHESVLRIFTCDPEIFDLLDDRISSLIPEQALRSAFDWFIRIGGRSLDRRIERTLARHAGSVDEKVATIIYMAVRQFRATRHLYRDFEWNALIGQVGDTSADFAALHVRKHLGVEEIGMDRDVNLLARGLARIKSADVDERATARVLERFRLVLLTAELSGERYPLEEPRPPKIEEVAKRIKAIKIDTVHDVRNKVAAIADRARLLDRGLLRKLSR